MIQEKANHVLKLHFTIFIWFIDGRMRVNPFDGLDVSECDTNTPSWLNHSLPHDVSTSSVFSYCKSSHVRQEGQTLHRARADMSTGRSQTDNGKGITCVFTCRFTISWLWRSECNLIYGRILGYFHGM
mgnify:CR=1 FL=1